MSAVRARRGGRRRLEGERFACGRLKPPAPNPRVLAERRALAGAGGDIRAAGHPLDLARARGWISREQFEAGERFARLYRQARLEAPDQERRSGLELEERAETVDRRRLRDMGRAEIAQAFDAVFCSAGDGDPDARAAAATVLWKRINAGLSAAEQAEAFRVCVRGAWPAWMFDRAAGRVAGPGEGARRVLLRALDLTSEAMAARTTRPAGERLL